MRYSEFAELEGKITKSAYLPAFPQKKWFGSNSPEVIEQRRGELERWLSAAVQTQECLTDPAFLGFLAVPLPSPVMRAGGAAPEASALGASGGSSSSSAKPEPITLNASVRPPPLLFLPRCRQRPLERPPGCLRSIPGGGLARDGRG